MTLAEAQLMQAAHTALGIDDNRYYLFDDDGTPKRIRMSNGIVSDLSNDYVYIRPVAVVTVNKD